MTQYDIEEKPRNLKCVYIQAKHLFGMFSKPTRSSIEGIPEDVQIHDVYWSPKRDAFVFILQHPSFPELKPFEEVPFHDGYWQYDTELTLCDKDQASIQSLKRMIGHSNSKNIPKRIQRTLQPALSHDNKTYKVQMIAKLVKDDPN